MHSFIPTVKRCCFCGLSSCSIRNKLKFFWNVRFSQRWVWMWLSSGLYSTVLSGTNLPTFQKRFKTMMMKAVSSSETFVSIDQTSSYCIPKDSHHKNTFDCLWNVVDCLPLRPNDAGSTYVWNIGLLQRDHTPLYSRKPSSSYSLPWTPEILDCIFLFPTINNNSMMVVRFCEIEATYIALYVEFCNFVWNMILQI